MNNEEYIRKHKELISKNEEEISELDKRISDITDEMSIEYFENEQEAAYQDYISNPGNELEILTEKKVAKQIEIEKHEAEIEKENYKAIYEKEKHKYKNGIVASDKSTPIDLLSRRTYSKTLAEYISNINTETPFNIGVFGKWGEGKSAFINFIEEELYCLNLTSQNENNYYIHPVKYDASEYSEQNKIWASILKILFDKFEEEKGIKAKFTFSFHRFIKRFRKNLWKYISMSLTIIILFIWGYYFYKDANNLSELKKMIVYSSLGIIPLIMSITNVIIPFIKNQIKFIKPLSDRVVANVDLPSYDNELGIRENIKEDLKDLLHVWLKNNKQGNVKIAEHTKKLLKPSLKMNQRRERIVLFVDELDRCSEKGIIEFLDALQLFLGVEDLVIILSINYNSIYQALIEKYDYLKGENISDSEKIKFCAGYIEKYITIPIYLHYEGDYNEYIYRLFEKAENKLIFNDNLAKEAAITNDEAAIYSLNISEKKVFSSEEKELFDNIIKRVNKVKHITPREVKRIFNIIILLKQVTMTLNEKSNNNEKIRFEYLLRWFTFSYFCPRSSFALLEYIKIAHESRKLKSIIPHFRSEEPIKQLLSEEIYAEMLLSCLEEIRPNQLKIYMKVSSYFILDERNFKL
ncbi:MAG TPA: P-loop NTPase fold protein [Clostridia bacterium]|nr:P-loop NTPase fold protein [Clostridia bacterium]